MIRGDETNVQLNNGNMQVNSNEGLAKTICGPTQKCLMLYYINIQLLRGLQKWCGFQHKQRVEIWTLAVVWASWLRHMTDTQCTSWGLKCVVTTHKKYIQCSFIDVNEMH